MAEEDTWEPRENLGNTEDLVKEFKKEYGEIGRVRKRRNKDRKGELSDRYMAKMLYGWDDKRFNKEYQRWLERNWNKWKGKEKKRINNEEEEEKDKEERIEEWDEEDKIGKMEDPYDELQKIFGMKNS